MLHTYKTADVKKCMSGRRVLFIGDQTARQVFLETVRSYNSSITEFPTIAQQEQDWAFNTADNINFQFIWDPLMAGSGLANISALAANTEKNGGISDIQFIYISFGRSYAAKPESNGQDTLFESFNSVVASLVPKLVTLATARPLDGHPAPKVVVSPVLEPYYQKVESNLHFVGLTSNRISILNKHLIDAFPLHNSSVYLPQVFNMISYSRPDSYTQDGTLLVPNLSKLQADLVFNMACNTKISTDFPYANTCCLDYPRPRGMYSFVHWMALLLIPVWIVGTYIYTYFDLNIAEFISRVEQDVSFNLNYSFITVLLGLLYCYACDRTQLFAKGNKYFVSSEFAALSVISILAGLFTSKRILDPKKQGQQNATFLNRFQTDEWKGWMQLAILIYHITGASQKLPIYKVIRIMVASYLFMTGYGHATFFIAKGDFGLKRFVSVMCRLNILTIFLAYVMNTNYLFYYFSPLVSFWFCIIWLTFRIAPQYNAGLKSSLVKVTISGILAYAFVAFEGPMEVIFWCLKTFCQISWDLREWRFRVLLDIWAVHFGMVISILVHNPEMSNVYDSINQSASPRLRSIGGTIIGLLLMAGYWNVSDGYILKVEYNEAHKYLSLPPILGFVLFRNAAPLINIYSTFFAWIGKISLETFILQFHIWMAADTKGILYMVDMGLVARSTNFFYTGSRSSGVFDTDWLSGTELFQFLSYSYDFNRYLNFILTTIPFLFISQQIALASGVLTTWFVTPEKLLPKEKKSISKLGVPVSVLKKDEEEGNKNLQEGEGVSVNVDPDTVIGDRKIESIELKDLESNLGELDSNNETQASDGLLGQRGGTSSGIEPTVSTSDEIVFSSSPSVRILQKVVLLFSKLSKELKVRLLVLLLLLWFLNICW